jgi:D-alanine-D-alanine ligase
MQKLKVAILYGGKSGEHDVSMMSAASVMEQLDDTKYAITPVYITREGRWPLPVEQLREFDVVFPVLHGPNGEDGSVQGLLSVIETPYVGAGVVGSAVGMDKAIFKDVMRAHNLPVTKYRVLRRIEWPARRVEIETEVITAFGLPVFVKPANMGSSVGITRAGSLPELAEAIDKAFRWDRKILIEKAVRKPRELEVSVLGNDVLEASVVGEIVPRREFYDYEAKYFASGDEESALLVPAPIPEPLSVLMRETAIEVALLADVRGMARVDFLLDTVDNEVFVSEINTIPGFTEVSMYPRMWQASGLSYPALLDKLIALALEESARSGEHAGS